MIRRGFELALIFCFCLTLVACGSFGKKLKSFVGGKSSEDSPPPRPRVVKFSENKSIAYNDKNRNYQRMTRERFEQESRVNENTGSLWVMEGQGSYLFSSNTLRLVGEIVNVKLDGNPKSQLETKVKVIKQLLARLDKPKRRIATARKPGGPNQPAVAQQEAPQGDQPGEPSNENDKKEEETSDFQVDVVPARIVDRTVEGLYRIKGTQNFMIGKREYKVIVTGLVRPNDVNGDVVEAPQLLEPKFDVVSLKKELRL